MTSTKDFFETSPFSLVPTMGAAKIWASSANARVDIQRVYLRLRGNTSTLDLIWATFGSGKTHALYHLQQQIWDEAEASKTPLFPVYLELHESTRTFFELYLRIAAVLDWTKVVPLMEANISGDSYLTGDLRRIVNLYIHGNSGEREIAMRWLRGERVHLNDLRRTANVARRIETDGDAVEILSLIINACNSRNGKIVLLVDEFQRVAALNPRSRSSLMQFIRTLFNRNGVGLSVVLAITTTMRANALAIMPDELRTLLGSKPAISLPELTAEEAFTFCLRRLDGFRPAGYAGDQLAPFGRDVIDALVQAIQSNSKLTLIPRTLIQGLAALMEEIELREFQKIEAREVQRIVSDPGHDE